MESAKMSIKGKI